MYNMGKSCETGKSCGGWSSIQSALVGDAREAFEIPEELVSGAPWKTTLRKQHRLRGLGIILIVVGVVWYAVTWTAVKTGQCSS